jgi:NAD(P) transhydrogenase
VLEHQFARNQVTTLRGDARFKGKNSIEVDGEQGETFEFSADSILLAVGTVPFRPHYVPFDDKQIFDSDGILSLDHLPRSIAVIGAGVIGIEYATIFSSLDVHVTLIEPRETMLDFIDRELIGDFTHQLKDRGMVLRFGRKAEKISKLDDGMCEIQMEGGRNIRAEMVLFAAGRMGATASLNLAACGLESDSRGRIKVDPVTFATEVPSIYAAGDVIGFPSLASTSMEQGRIAACHALGRPPTSRRNSFPTGSTRCRKSPRSG